MKVLAGSYFQKEPPTLVLRYSNLLSEIRQLLATWTPSRQIPDLAVKNFQIWNLTLDAIQSSKQHDMDIWTTTHLRSFTIWKRHSNVRKTLSWLFATLLCWFRTTKYLLGKCYLHFIALIKPALIVHRILYSFCKICNITKGKSIRKTCIEFYLSLRRSI